MYVCIVYTHTVHIICLVCILHKPTVRIICVVAEEAILVLFGARKDSGPS